MGIKAVQVFLLAAAALSAAAEETNGLAARYAGEIRFAEDGRERPSIENGTFHLAGRPVFFLGPWIYNHTKEDWPPGNPDPQGVGHFAYRELPGQSVFERIGFNASQLSAAWGDGVRAREIVRCRDCVHYETDEVCDGCTLFDFADCSGSMVDKFCAWGEKR